MASRKAKSKKHLPDGRHVATVCTDELMTWAAQCLYGNVRKAAESELAKRKAPRTRTYKPGPSFPLQTANALKHVGESPSKKSARPDMPTKIKDAKKDRKKNPEQ